MMVPYSNLNQWTLRFLLKHIFVQGEYILLGINAQGCNRTTVEYSKQSIHWILRIFRRFCLLLCLARDTNGLKHTDTNESNYFQKSVWQKSKSWCIHTINLPWERVLSKAFSNSTCNRALSVVFLVKQQYLRRDLVKQTWKNCYKHSTGGELFQLPQ